MNHTWRQSAETAVVIVLAALLAGCTAARAPHAARANAPGLDEDAPLSRRGGANPNAPYASLDRSVHLVHRPSLLEVNAAAPCAAADLSLFESGARVDGARRSVRLNLVNHGPQPCRLGGYPAITLLREDGTAVGSVVIENVTATSLEAAMLAQPRPDTSADVRTEMRPAGEANPVQASAETTTAPSVLLSPSGEASFELAWVSGPLSGPTRGATCSPVASIAIAGPVSNARSPDGTEIGATDRSGWGTFTVHHPLTICEGRIQVTALR